MSWDCGTRFMTARGGRSFRTAIPTTYFTPAICETCVGNKIRGAGRLASHFSIGFSYGRETSELKAVQLSTLESGASYQLDHGILSWGHRTNAEKACLSKLPAEDFGIRIETPIDTTVSYWLALTDRLSSVTFKCTNGCGGQEDGRPGYNCTQDWFPKEYLAKKFVVARASRSYSVDFLEIPIPAGLGH